MSVKPAALFVEVDVTDEDVRRGRMLQIAWLYRCRLGFWNDGAPRPLQLRDDLAAASIVVGYDVHRVIGPHLAYRHGLQVGWPRADLRTMLGLLPVEVDRRYLPVGGSNLTGIMRRLGAVRAAWDAVRSRR